MALRNGKKTAGDRKNGKKSAKPAQKKKTFVPPRAKSPKGGKGVRKPPLTPQQRKRYEEIGKLTPLRGKKWTYEREAELCQLWQEEDSLYNTRNPDYREPERRTASFQRIAAILRMDPVDVETHAKSMRTAYTKLTSPQPSGSSPATERLTKRQREILTLCSFLADHIRNRESLSNLDEEVDRTDRRRRSPRLAGRDPQYPKHPKIVKKKRFVQTAAAAKAAREAQAAQDGRSGPGRKTPKKGHRVKQSQAPKDQQVAETGTTHEESGVPKIHNPEGSTSNDNSEHEGNECVDEHSEQAEYSENDYYEHEYELDEGNNVQQEGAHDHDADGDDDSYVFTTNVEVNSESDDEMPMSHPGPSKPRKRKVHDLSDFEDMDCLDENPIPNKKVAKRGKGGVNKEPPNFYVSSLKRRTAESKSKEQLADIMGNRTEFLRSLTTSIENLAENTDNQQDRNVAAKDNYDLWTSILCSRIRDMGMPLAARFMLYVDKLVLDVVVGGWEPPK